MSQTRITDNISGNLNTNSPGGAGLTGLNRRDIEPIPMRLRNISKYYFIYNISDHRPNPRIPVSWTRSLGGLGTWYVWAREEGLVSKPTIVPEVFVEQFDAGIPGGWGNGNLTGRISYREEEGERIVREILGTQPPTTQDNDLTDWGVFLAAGERPTTQEIDEATEKMVRTYQVVVQDGDQKWSNADTKKEITAVHVRAAAYLLQEREWCSPPKKMIACAGCGMPVYPHVAYHAGPNGCGTIVNFELAKKLRQQEADLAASVEKPKKQKESAA